MSIFGKDEKLDLRFASRAEAFAFMLAFQMDKVKDPMTAAKLADEFADLYASNMGLPNRKEPPLEGVDRYLVSIDKVVAYCEGHPKVLDFVTGAVTFAAGTFFGKKIESDSEPVKIEKIDVSKLD